MPEIERDGEELPRLSPGVGCDSTAQGDKLTIPPILGASTATSKTNEPTSQELSSLNTLTYFH